MKTHSLILKLCFAVLFACNAQAFNASFRMDGSVLLDTIVNTNFANATATLSEEGGATIARLRIYSTSTYDPTDPFSDTCDVATLGVSSSNVTVTCGKTYLLTVSGQACSASRPINARFNLVPAGYIVEFLDTSNNSLTDNSTSVKITGIQSKTWKVNFKPKRVHFTVEPLAPDGQSQSQAKLSFQTGASRYFTGVPQWSIVGDNLGCTIDSSNGWIRAGTEAGEITVRATDSSSGKVVSGALRVGCQNCTVSCGIGQGTVGNLRNAAAVSLGDFLCDNSFLGSLRLKLTSPASALTTPAGLFYDATNSDNALPEVLRDGSSALRQILAAQCLADVVTTVANSEYEIRLYWPENAGTKTNGLYQPTGSPFKTWRVTSLAGGNTQFKITEDPSGANTTNAFTWSGTDTGWTLNRGDLRQERKIVVDGLPAVAPRETSRRSETVEISAPGSTNIASRITKTFATLSLNGGALQRTNILVEERGDGRKADGSVANPDQVTSYFYAATATADGHEKLQRITRSDGSWNHYEYDTSNRVSIAYSPWLDSTPPSDIDTAPTSVPYRKTVYAYTPMSSSGDPGTNDFVTARQIDAYGNDGTTVQLISRSFVTLTVETNRYPATDTRRDIDARNASAVWNDASNPVTITRTMQSGAFSGALQSIERPDGTRTVYAYTENSTDIRDGTAGVAQDSVTDGRRTTTTKTSRGYVQTNTVVDIVTGKKLVSDVWSIPSTNDAQGRFTLLTHLDGTTETFTYDCCNLVQATDRDGATTVFTPDAAKRIWKTTTYYSASLVNGIDVRNTFDALGNITRTTRIGSDSSSIDVVPVREFDRAGRAVREQNALGGYTTTVVGTNSSGGRKVTATLPDGGTRIDESYRDGRTAKIYGTAVNPVRFDYLLGTNGEVALKETKLDAAGSPTSEWRKTYTDFLGRDYKTVFADATTGDESDNPSAQLYFKDNGQLWKERDPDGVFSVNIFNTRGEIEYTVSGQKTEPTTPPTAPDTSGEPRISRVERFVGSYIDGITNSTLVIRVTEWTNANSANVVVTSETHTSLDGLQQWSVDYPNETFKQVAKTATQYGSSGARTVTTTYPDGSYEIALFSYGRPASVTRYSSTGGTVSQTTLVQDAHNRLGKSIDARNGTNTFTYNNADQLSSVTTPSPGAGQSAQTESVAYDLKGRPTQVTLPDSQAIYARYYSNDLVKLTWGARTTPAGYEYDPQGRTAKLYTWQNFVAPDPGLANPSFPSGATTTTWHYDAYRGWPQDKRYADNTGPDYTYTSGGRPKTRSWSRGIPGSPATRATTTYTYDFDAAGDNANRKAGYLARTDYNDGTPSLAFDYDRRGNGRSVTQGTGGLAIVTALGWHTSGLLNNESFSGSFLDTLGVFAGNVDALNILRRTSLEVRKSGVAMSGTAQSYGYDAAWRFAGVTNGTFSANYAFAPNSDLVVTNIFRQNTTTRMTTARQFDSVNRMQSVQSLNAAQAVLNSFAYAYNSANQRTTRTDADASTWQFGYDLLGQVTSAKHYWPTSIVAGQQFEFGFDWSGNRLFANAGGNLRGENLHTSTYGPNALNQYTNRTVPPWVTVLGDASTNATVSVNVQPTKRQSSYYWTELWFNNSTGAVYASITNVGAIRRTNQADVVSTSTGTAYVPKSPEQFLHDADGNLTNDGRWSLTWDAENRLISVQGLSSIPGGAKKKVDCSYDYSSRRIQKIVSTWTGSAYVASSTNRFLYDGANLIAVLNETNGLLYSFMWGSDLSGSLQGAGGVGGLVSMTVYNGPLSGTYFYCYDGNGNVIALVNGADGTVAARYEYGPFGELIRANGPMAFVNPFRFSTKFHDDETGFICYRFRYYNPSAGRWISRDPLDERAGLNLYGFCLNNGVNALDSDGRQMFIGLEIYVRPAIEFGVETAPKFGEIGYQNFRVPPELFNQIQPQLRPIGPGLTPPVPIAVDPTLGTQPNPKLESGPNPTSTRKVEDAPEAYLYRAMTPDRVSGGPLVGQSARTLGVRRGSDVEISLLDIVKPKNSAGKYQGMSVSPNKPNNLFYRFRPKELIGPIPGGVGPGQGKDPVWKIRRNEIPGFLDFHQDSPTHGVIYTKECIKFDDYERLLESTKPLWKLTDLTPFLNAK